MRIPRFSIGGLMVMTCALAVQLAAIRAALAIPDRQLRLAVHVSLPMGALVTVLGLVLGRRRLRGREVSPFAAGFVALGTAATATVLGFALACHDCFLDHLLNLLRPIESIIRPIWPLVDPSWAETVEYLLAPLPVFLPQLVVASVGGWLNTRFRVTIARRRPSPPGQPECLA